MLTPDSFLWKALEFYGTSVHHRGKWRVHEKLRRLLNVNYSGNLEVSRQGLQWLLNPCDFVQSSFYWTGEFESWDWYHLSQFVRPGNVVFDIGANFGYYSLMLAHQAKARVVAFEPCSTTFSRLKSNILMNGLETAVTAVPIGLSDQPRSGYLSSVAGNSGSNFLAGHGEKVELDTLDHYCKVNGYARIDFIKIDVEGHELHVLSGAQHMLKTCKPGIMIEFNVMALRRAGSSPEHMEAHLRSLGYRLFLPVRKKLVPFEQAFGPEAIFNIFALREAP
jgi:FkbM family methyltransferase